MATVDFSAYVSNAVDRPTTRYAAILGATPSRGARSPLLWNAAFERAGSPARMIPLDVTPEALPDLVAALRADERFVGGAVTMPYKERLTALVDEVERQAQPIGAINALYRGPNGQLLGANTDGAAALAEATELAGDLSSRRVLVIGLGGAGVAVAAYLRTAAGRLLLCNRSPERAATIGERLETPVVPWPPEPSMLAEVDVLVNCASAGHVSHPDAAPLGPEQAAAVAALPPHAAVYDIIYQPAETPLLAAAAARGLNTRGGLGMNLEQAVIAFARANPGRLRLEDIRAAMRMAG